jgi:glucans biosynthesis protein
VHDSDGLLLHFDGGEWLWRPLDNPSRINAASFRMHDPRGFGLIQRDRDFANYQDIETRLGVAAQRLGRAARRLGLTGAVELVEIPSANEKLDNMVAYWVPAKPPVPGDQLTYSYTLTWYMDDPSRPAWRAHGRHASRPRHGRHATRRLSLRDRLRRPGAAGARRGMPSRARW